MGPCMCGDIACGSCGSPAKVRVVELDALRDEIYCAVLDERKYQDQRWGGIEHDSGESVGNFLIYIERYLQKAKDAYVDAQHNEAALHEVRKIAALAFACMEVHGVVTRKGAA